MASARKPMPVTLVPGAFETFISGFEQTAQLIEAQSLDTHELVALLRPWVKETRHIIAPILCVPEHARQLRSALNRVLDYIELGCVEHGQRFADALIQLSPIEDLLVALSLVERGLLPRKEAADA